MDNKSESEPGPEGPGSFYETIDLALAKDSQTLLAYEMNGERLSIPHGAPLRLRVETQLGFKMVKWLEAIELVGSYRHIGEGQGGWREDFQHYGQDASI
jgi:methionine sulfoxide reductase catalytic subunit